jgi:hypothetical protein
MSKPVNAAFFTKAYQVRITAGEERERLWQTKCLKQMAGFAVYQDMAGEPTISVVVLEAKRAA